MTETAPDKLTEERSGETGEGVLGAECGYRLRDRSSRLSVGMTTRVVRGAVWTASGQGLMLLASVVSVPFVIRLLGSESYGLLVLISVLIGYLGFADLGMGLASTRFGADAYAREDESAEAAVIWTALLIASIPAAAGVVLFGFLAGPFVTEVLRVPPQMAGEAVLALRIAAVGFFARSITGVLNTPQVVRLRTDLNTLLNAGAGVAQSLLVVAALLAGGKLVTAVAAMAATAIAAALAQGIVSSRLLPQLTRPRISRALAKPLARYGLSVVVTTLLSVVLVNAEKVILARLSSLRALAYYSVAYNVAFLLTIAPFAMAQWLLPAFAQLQAASAFATQKRLYSRASRAILLCTAPTVLVLCGWAKPFLSVWVGPEFSRESALPLYILLVGVSFGAMALVPHSLLMACGRANLIARIHLAEVLPYAVCAAVLTYWLGAIGAALAWSLRLAVETIVLHLAAWRAGGIVFSPLPPNRGSYYTAVLTLFLPLPLIVGASSSLPLMVGATAFSLLTYGGLIWIRVLTDEERAWLINMSIFRRVRLTGDAT